MTTVPANPVMIDSLDSYYNYVAAKINALDPDAFDLLQGLSNAQDWPQTELVDGGLYLLYLSSMPIEEESTQSQTYYEHFLQWSWAFLGDDIQPNQVAANRGSRYRSDLAVVELLRQAHFPGFSPKLQAVCDPVTGAVTFVPYSPVEMIKWSKPRLGTKLAIAQSGISYGTAPVEVYAWSTVNPLVNP